MHQGSIFHSRLWFAVALFFAVSAVASAQGTATSPRITASIDEASLTTLQGNTHPLARPEFDRGPAPISLPMQRMLLVLKRSTDQEAALNALLDQQQDKSSPNYHQWLTPDRFGRQFGPADQDILTVTQWLQSHGFEVNRVLTGRGAIEFSGTAGQVQEAFHTPIHRFAVNGEERWANSVDPRIPSALVPVVAGIDSLNNFPRRPMSQISGPVLRSKATGQITPASPMFNLGGTCGVPGIGCHAVGPYDFATIYDLSPLSNATPHIDGSGQTIAIAAASNINIQDARDFRNFFGLPAKDPQIIVNGADPGLISRLETEADLDTEWAGTVAPNATIDLIVSESTESTSGADLSAEYAVENNVAPILSVSFGECEAGLGTAGNQFFSQLWQQAAAQGITVLVSTGDNGSAGCDDPNGTAPLPAKFGLQVNGLSSTPYNVAVGGTDFNDLTNASTYWNTSNAAPPGNPGALPTLSAKSYIPETTWNDSCTNAVFGALLGFSTNAETNCNDSQLVNFVVPIGASGGKSSCTSGNGSDVTTCSGGYAKPSWQVGAGVPGDGKRDLPDLSLFAASGSPSGSFYVVCEADALFQGASSCDPTNANTSFLAVGGTSASVQVFAGIMALVNQETNSIQGNANYILYKLAAQQPSAFHDVPTGGTIAMPCTTGTPNCVTSTPADVYGVLSGYATAGGYDLATGLGSVDANNFVTKWSSVTTTLKASATTLTLNSGNPVNITHGQSVNVAIGVTGSPGTPTGNASLIANTGPSGQDGIQDFTLASGAVSSATTLLPGGTYSVFARYAGDGVFGPSTSSPAVSVTIAQESSKTGLAIVTFDPSTGKTASTNAASFPYGSPYILRADVTNNSGSNCFNSSTQSIAYACPTGSVGLKDNGVVLGSGTFALNTQGYTEFQAIQLTGGSHTLTAAYGGDGSYSASAGTDAVTVTPAPTTTIFFSPISTMPPQTIILGTPFFISVQAQANSSGVIPGGTFTIFDGTTPLAGTESTSGSQVPSSPPQVFLNGSIQTSISGAGGLHTLTAHYSGDSNYASSVSSAVTLDALYPVSITLSATPNPVLYGNSVTVTATLSTGNPASNAALKPTGTLSFSASGGGITGGVNPTVTQDSSGNWVMQSTVTTTPPSSESIQVTYSGDSNYASSTQVLFVDVNIPDFNVSGTSTPLVITAGQTGTATITVAPLTSYTSTVTLGCGTSIIAGATCTFSPSSVTLSGGSSATTVLTLATLAPSSAMTAMTAPRRIRGVPLTPFDRDAWWGLSALAGLASLMVFVLSGRPRFPRAALGLALVGLFSFVIGCGGGSSGSGAGAGAGGGVGGGTGPAATTTTINTTSTKFALGDSANLTATVKSSSPTTGDVTFNDASFPFVIGFATLANGTAQIQMSATGSIFPGTHAITAQYNGNNLPSQSGTLNIAVTGDTSQLVVGQTGPDAHTIQLNVTIQ